MATSKKPANRSGGSRRSAPSDDGGSASQMGEQYTGADNGTGLIEGNRFGVKAVTYAVVDGRCIFEGDIDLGSVDEVEARTSRLRDDLSGERAASVIISGDQFRWPNCRVPFEIDAALPNPQRVRDAIAHWETNTRFRFIERTPANAASHPDFVRFVNGSGCSSAVGRRGGMQTVTLASGCTVGNAIHEIGHVIGLWHEQSREDRDSFVTVQWANIQAGREHNFNQHITDGDDVGAYDYGSIMHYPRDAFSVNGQDTLVPTTPGVSIGQRTALSAGDIASANAMCPPKLVKELAKDSIKDIRKDIRDDVKLAIKDIRKDIRDDVKLAIKDIRKDIRDDVTVKEMVADPTIKEGTYDPTIKEGAFDPPFGGIGGRVTNPPWLGGRALPFGVAGPGGPGAAGDAASQVLAEYDEQLTALAAAISGLDTARAVLEGQLEALAGERDQVASELM
jgi:hypothetical protein